MILSANDSFVILRSMPPDKKIPVRVPGLPVFHAKPAEIITMLHDGRDVLCKGDSSAVAWCAIMPRAKRYRLPDSFQTTVGSGPKTEHHKRHCKQWNKKVDKGGTEVSI